MKKKGFTLIELIGVVVLLGAVLLIIIPVVNKSLKEGKQKLYDKQIETIKTSLNAWANENKPKNNETFYLTLSQLKSEGLVDVNIKNPITNEPFANDMILKVINENNILKYEVLTDTGSCKSNYTNIPKFDLNNSVEYIEINTVYNDTIPVVKDKLDNVLNNSKSEGSVNSTKIGSYYITYSVSKDGDCNAVIKNVVVRDTQAPIIRYSSDLTINKSEINTYNFLSDVTATDNSNTTPTITVEHNLIAVPGLQSVTYKAVDSSGNVTTKTRSVIVK